MTTPHTGVLIVESLRPECTLTVPGMVVNGIHRFASADPLTPVWTLLDIEVPDDQAESLARQLETALTDGPWYADYGNGTSHTVVFPGRVFTYTAGDSTGRRAAHDHGLSLGVPEHQLDWTEDATSLPDARSSEGMAPDVRTGEYREPMRYDPDTTLLGTLLADPEVVAILEKHSPGITKNPMIGMAKGMTASQALTMGAPMLGGQQVVDAIRAEVAGLV